MAKGDFSIQEIGGVRFLVSNAWWAEGLKHGMTMTDMSFSHVDRAECARRLCESFDADCLILLKQVHGRKVVDCRDSRTLDEMLERDSSFFAQVREGDALIVPSQQPIEGKRIIFGVLTADCVPVVLRGDSGIGVIHAGWRGLAQGIIEASAKALTDARDGIVLACAGSAESASYEVGPEVVAAIGVGAVAAPALQRDKFLLDTAQTAMTQLRQAIPMGSFVSAGICTISDERFHSFRRDAERAGRSVTFVCPPDAL
jgi:copper oxidase (laccase) domain-containing protein